jgi:glutamate synthase (NADPH) large chain
MPQRLVEEHDACALYASISKRARSEHEPIAAALDALERMAHRAGSVDGEGDGCGLQLDLPRELWAEALRARGHASQLALDPRFAVLHLFLPRGGDLAATQAAARELMSRAGLRVLAEREDEVDSSALGPHAREEEPLFWQLGGLIAERRLCFELQARLEQTLDLHVASCSTDVAVYKLLGSPSALARYYADLADPRTKTAVVLAHERYSTNTWPTFARVQPFGVLGHNGEINTIERLRTEARMLGVPLPPGGSDSQDLDRVVEALLQREELSLVEALELLLPPIVNELKGMPEGLRGFGMYVRQAFGPFAQGPAALIARAADECAFAVDALGLRPLWHLEAVDRHVFSSESGVLDSQSLVAEPAPLAPGEKLLVALDRGRGQARLWSHHAAQRLARDRWRARTGARAHEFAQAIPTGGPLEGPDIPGYTSAGPSEPVKVPDRVLGGFGWQREDMRLVQQLAATGAEPIGSLGYDGPLACLSPARQNLADYFKESVAVVTNPAIDREREVEHFSCRAVFGRRPDLASAPPARTTVETAFPIVLGGHDGLAPLGDATYRQVAREHKTYLLEDLWEHFRDRAAVLDVSCFDAEASEDALERLRHEATAAVRGGAELLVLSDRTAYEGDRRYLDAHLALAAVDLALRESLTRPGELNLRRRCGIVLRSAGLRNVHDVMLALGLGADGVCPYAMVEVALMDDYRADVSQLATGLRKGIEKVLSTLGIHELRGYGRLFACIGLRPELASVFGTPAYAASERGGVGFAELDADADRRRRVLTGGDEARPGKTFRFYPKVYKPAVAAAAGTGSYEAYSRRVRELELEQPIALRHLLDLRSERPALALDEVSAEVGGHSYPLVISSMSFGSQGEVAYRAYAEAARRVNVIALNGEGGEVPDLYGRYRRWRGQQIASGRFGVTSELVNSAALVEIKIGQGAKPGEGGHLPARKVTAKVAAARNASPGTDLISPSNNHDLYSIEDLAQLIDELKATNPELRVSVKVPVVPNIGTIAVGIAKAGADVITLSGFDGGTGAARTHALRHVGLPADLGTRTVHLALLEAGLRQRVEIWADGGFRHGHDVVKLLCLGANRIGFGTLAMVSLGCTICRGCQLDTCHVGIATQIESELEAQLKGLKKFTPQRFDAAASNCARFFEALGEEVRALVAELGFASAQELVGRTELLVQARERAAVDLTELLRPAEQLLELEALDPAPSLAPVLVAHAGERVGDEQPVRAVHGIAGQGLAAFAPEDTVVRVVGGAQDGVAKAAYGGTVAVMNGRSRFGGRVHGSVGKSFAYGAQRGRLYVQGDADSRCGVRLSGADVVVGGEPRAPLDDALGCLADRANLKGFAFEYMTAGRALVLGDPGPWLCAGQTGGRVYLRVNRDWRLDRAALERRLGKGAKVELTALDALGVADVRELLGGYAEQLRATEQDAEADRVAALAADPGPHFLVALPLAGQTDPSISTE